MVEAGLTDCVGSGHEQLEVLSLRFPLGGAVGMESHRVPKTIAIPEAELGGRPAALEIDTGNHHPADVRSPLDERFGILSRQLQMAVRVDPGSHRGPA